MADGIGADGFTDAEYEAYLNGGTAQSDTGKGNPNGIWGSIGGFLTGAGNLASGIRGPAKPKAAAPMPAWLVPVGIAVVVLVVIVGALRR